MDPNRTEKLKKKRLQIQKKREKEKEKRQKELQRLQKKNEIARSTRIAAKELNKVSQSNNFAKEVTEEYAVANDPFSDGNDLSEPGRSDNFHTSNILADIDEDYENPQNREKIRCKVDGTDNVLEENSVDFVNNERSCCICNTVNSSNKLQKVTTSLKYTKNREHKLRREIKKLKSKIKTKDSIIKVLQNKCYRLKRKIDKNDSDKIMENVKKIESKGKKAVRQRLLHCEVLQQQIIKRRKELEEQKSKSFLARIVSGPIVKKFKLMKENSVLTSEYLQRKHLNNDNPESIRLNEKIEKRMNLARKEIREFLERDDNSSMAPGSKDVITRSGVTMRKRFYSDTVSNLYKKYSQEGLVKISRATFFRFLPFWIVSKEATDRDTCLCKDHANFDFYVKKLFKLKYLPSSSAREVMEKFKCNIEKKSCMYNECVQCKADFIVSNNNNDRTFYYQWVTAKESRVGKGGKTFNVTITQKKKIECTVMELIDNFNKVVPTFLKHSYNTYHQYKALRDIETHLPLNHVKVVIDFSQNYIGKYASEIQSVHFGASKTQTTIHSGVFCYRDKKDNIIKYVSFCTASACLRHDAAAVWAHMQPILSLIKKFVPEVSTIHLQSDGPSTQYKNKTNFELFHQHCRKLKLESASWNFTTPGHGKSKADGAGGTAKTLCDRAVHAGRDVISVDDIIEVVSKSEKIHIFPVSEADIQEIDKIVRPDIKSAPKSQQIFQIIWNENKPDYLFLNSLSCDDKSCIISPPCQHFSLIAGGWSLKIVEKSNKRGEKMKQPIAVNSQTLKSKKQKLKEEIEEKEAIANNDESNSAKRKLRKKNEVEKKTVVNVQESKPKKRNVQV